MLLCVSIVFSWFLWCIVNFSEYRQFSGWPMVLEVIKDLAEQIVETTILLELSLLYIKGIVKIFWGKEKNIKNLILQVMLLAILNGISSVVSGWVYSWIFPKEEGLFAKIAYTDYLNLSILTTAYLVVFLMNRYRDESEAHLEASLRNLSLQTNNHFMFNSFSTMSGLIETSPAQAKEFNLGLASIYRYLVMNGAKTIVPLKDEIAFVKEYVRIAQYRYSGIYVRIDDNLTNLDCFVCPVVLQSLVENAIKHNRHGKENLLKVDMSLDDGYIVVVNNIMARQDEEPGTRRGLKNLIARYALLTDAPVLITNDGKQFEVRVPVLYLEDLNDESIDY